MKREALNLTEDDGYEALRGHVLERALTARERYGPKIDEGALLRLLQDGEIVRFPTHIVYDESLLLDGEFAWAKALGERPADGYQIVVAPMFKDRPDDLVAIVAYHLVRVNYLDVATHVEAELFGAALLGLEVDDYYERLCKLADELPRPAVREALSFDDIDEAVAIASGQSAAPGTPASCGSTNTSSSTNGTSGCGSCGCGA